MNCPDCLLASLKLMAAVVDDVTFSLDADGWNMSAVDPAHIAMIGVHIPAEQFGEVEDAHFAVDCRELIKVLSKKPDSISIVDGGMFVAKGKGWKRTLRLDMPEDGKGLPRLSGPCRFMCASEPIRTVVMEFDAKDAEAVTFIVSKDGLRISTGNSRGLMTSLVPKEDMLMLELEEAVKAAYPLDYWQRVLKAMPKDTAVQITLDSDYPAAMEFAVDGAECKWMVAPRIEEE